jgi:hypothetical protein
VCLLLFAGALLLAWRSERAEHAAAVALAEATGAPPPAAPAHLMPLPALAAVVAVVAVAYFVVVHDWLFTGDGRSSPRQTWIDAVEWLGRNRAVVFLVGLPAAAIFMTYVNDQTRRLRRARRRKQAIEQLANVG